MERREPCLSGIVGVDFDIIAHCVRRPKSVNAACREQLFLDDASEQLLRIFKKLARLRTDHRVIKNRGIPSAQFPSMKERRPIDVGNKCLERKRRRGGRHDLPSQKSRLYRRVPRPIKRPAIRPRLLEGDRLSLLRFRCVRFAQSGVVRPRLLVESFLQVSV